MSSKWQEKVQRGKTNTEQLNFSIWPEIEVVDSCYAISTRRKRNPGRRSQWE